MKTALKLPPAEGNKTEQAFGLWLLSGVQRGEYLWYAYEPWKLRLAKKTWYTPDFVALDEDGMLVVYEVKGFWRDDARVKIKVAAEMYKFLDFVAVTKKEGRWEFEEIP